MLSFLFLISALSFLAFILAYYLFSNTVPEPDLVLYVFPFFYLIMTLRYLQIYKKQGTYSYSNLKTRFKAIFFDNTYNIVSFLLAFIFAALLQQAGWSTFQVFIIIFSSFLFINSTLVLIAYNINRWLFFINIYIYLITIIIYQALEIQISLFNPFGSLIPFLILEII